MKSKRHKAKEEPAGTTHLRVLTPDDDEEGLDINLVRVSLGRRDGACVWFCIYADGTFKFVDDSNAWNDEWVLV